MWGGRSKLGALQVPACVAMVTCDCVWGGGHHPVNLPGSAPALWQLTLNPEPEMLVSTQPPPFHTPAGGTRPWESGHPLQSHGTPPSVCNVERCWVPGLAQWPSS